MLAPSWVMMKRMIRAISGPPVAFSVRSFDEEERDGRLGEHLLLELIAVQELVEREEDRQLENQRNAGGERVDLVLLVERDHLPLLALLVVLVALLDRLDLRRIRLQRAHRADLGDRKRQDHEPRRERERDDRKAPAQADVVVEEGDDRVGEVDQRLEDVRDDHACAPACVCLCVSATTSESAARKSFRSETGSQPPWLQGLQRRRRQPARIEPRMTPSSRTAPTA